MFSTYLYRGLVRFDLNNKAGAKADLQKSYKLLPTPPASYYLGEIALESGDKQTATRYFQTAAQGNDELAKKAQGRLAVLELATSPHKYIVSKTYVGDDGYLRIVVQNNSPVTVTSVKLQLAEMANAYMVESSSSLNGPQELAPGQKATIKTRIGPFKEAAEASRYRAKVVSVQVPE